MITTKNARRLALRYRAEARRLRKENRQLCRDNGDMHDSFCTSFQRCKFCGHLHDINLRCTACGKDPSEE